MGATPDGMLKLEKISASNLSFLIGGHAITKPVYTFQRMNFREYKDWIGKHAITKIEWEQLCISGKQIKLFEPDYVLFQQREGLRKFGKAYRTSKENSTVSIVCWSKMTEKEIDKLMYVDPRPIDGWNVTMKIEDIVEPFNGHVFATPDGIMDNGGSGDGYSRLMSLDIELPSMSEISYDN